MTYKAIPFWLLMVCCSMTFTLLSQIQRPFSSLVSGQPAVCVTRSWRDLPPLVIILLLSANLSHFGA